MGKRYRLHLFTANFPTGFGESFLNNELPFLEKTFDEVTIYPHDKKDTQQKAFQNSSQVVCWQDDKKTEPLSTADKLFLVNILLKEFIQTPKKRVFLKRSRELYAQLKNTMLLANWMKEERFSVDDLYYSFWMNEWALALALAKKRGKNIRFVFRVNGYDIYSERHPGGYMPFQHFIYEQADRIIPLSKTSEAYLKSKNIYPDKIKHSYFGTKDPGPIEDKKDNVFTVFSCSSAKPLKRLDKIAKVLSLLPFDVKWVHHGDGGTIKDVEKIVNTTGNIEFTLSSKVEDYNEVIRLQQKLVPDLFINLSTTEGLPITAMEAISMGIPLLLNDVGSCREYIVPATGILVEPNEDEQTISEKIVNFREQQSAYSVEKIRAFWHQNFSAEKKYSEFAKSLINIIE